MSKRKQQALGYFGFAKKVVHREKKQEVKIPNFIDAEEVVKLISLSPRKFQNQQGLSIHIKCKHAR